MDASPLGGLPHCGGVGEGASTCSWATPLVISSAAQAPATRSTSGRRPEGNASSAWSPGWPAPVGAGRAGTAASPGWGATPTGCPDRAPPRDTRPSPRATPASAGAAARGADAVPPAAGPSAAARSAEWGNSTPLLSKLVRIDGRETGRGRGRSG